MKNVYELLPCNLDKKDKDMFENTKDASFSLKEAKRGVDYRKSLVDCTASLVNKIDNGALSLMRNFCEIQDLLYAKESKWLSKRILRLYNVTFTTEMTSKKIS